MSGIIIASFSVMNFLVQRIKVVARFVLTLIVLLSTSFTGASAFQGCALFLRSLDRIELSADPFVNSDRTEIEIRRFSEEVAQSFGANSSKNERLGAILDELSDKSLTLQKIQDSLLQEKDVHSSSFEKIFSELVKLRREFEYVKDQKTTITLNQQSAEQTSNLRRIDELINEPSLAVAGKLYAIEMASGKEMAIVISKKVISDVFRSSHLLRSVSQSLQRMKKGVFSGRYEGEGVIILRGYKRIFEVRLRGKNGNFRFFGYLKEGILYIVHYTTSSKHSSFSERNIKQVKEIRRERGHN